MTSFTSTPATPRVVFASGEVLRINEHLDAIGMHRVHLIGSPRSVALVRRVLGERVVVETASAVQHVPRALVDERLRAQQGITVDGYVAVGGGSSIGLAKALALSARAPLVAVPTTYSGSEMSPIWGVTDGGVKTTGRHPDTAPLLVLYDPDLLSTLPPELGVTSAVNALAHAVEATFAHGASPVLTWVAAEAVTRIIRNIAGLASNEEAARADTLVGSWLAGQALYEAPMGLHHALAHALGGSQTLPHAPLHTVLLPFVIRFWASAAPNTDQLVLSAIDTASGGRGAAAPGAQALQLLIRDSGGPTSLARLGADPTSYRDVAERVARGTFPTPAVLTPTQVERLLVAAHHGVLDDCPVVPAGS